MDWLAEIRNNPFWVLNASPRDRREVLIRKQADMALFGEDAASGQALAALLHPQTRLEAELRWFPRTETEAVRRLVQFTEEFREGQQLMYLQTESVLARFYGLRLQMPLFRAENAEQLTAVFHALAAVADGLFPRQVLDEINADRRQSRFEQLKETAEIGSGIRQMLRETVDFFLDRFPAEKNDAVFRTLSGQYKKEYTERKSPYHNSYLMELASGEAGLRA